MNFCGKRFRYRKNKTQPRDLRQAYNRHRLCVGGGPGLNEGAGIRITISDNTGEGRSDPRVARERAVLPLIRLCHFELLLGSRKLRLSTGELTFALEILGLGIVELLLRYQTRTRLG